MVPDTDVVIVGGRCAGASLAIRLARAGLRVTVVDRATFPNETLSTHVIQPGGVASLADLGVTDELFALSAPIDRVTIALGEVRTDVRDLPMTFGSPLLNVRRATLDAVLLAAAAGAGADIHAATNVREVLREGDRVVGVRTDAGDITASLVVGADGVRSAVAHLVGADEYAMTPPGRLFVWGYFEGAAVDEGDASAAWIGKLQHHGFLASHTDGGLFMAVATTDLDRKAEVLADREGHFRAALEEWPELARIVAPGRPVDGMRVVSSWQGYFRPSAGPGWALVGDAGHFKDPTAGQGIGDALRQAEWLARAIVAGIGDRALLDRELAAWWRWRDDDAWATYWFAGDLGAAGVTPPLLLAIQQRIGRNPRLTEGLLRVLNHERSPATLNAPTVVVPGLIDALRRPATTRLEVAREIKTMVGTELVRRRLRKKALQLHARR
jgi:2-polyprenyl-6-methoxyphenol hydroxylase-like FAD-dependent oxidoreductase